MKFGDDITLLINASKFILSFNPLNRISWSLFIVHFPFPTILLKWINEYLSSSKIGKIMSIKLGDKISSSPIIKTYFPEDRFIISLKLFLNPIFSVLTLISIHQPYFPDNSEIISGVWSFDALSLINTSIISA